MNRVYLTKKMLEISWFEEKTANLTAGCVKGKAAEMVEKFNRHGFCVAGKILDVGCGSGVDLLALFSINPKIEAIGVDLCRKALEFAKGILPRQSSHLILADAVHLPFREGSFNAINVSNMLHHHPLTLIKRILRKLASLLDVGGTLIIEEPSVESEGEALAREIDVLKSGFETYLNFRREISSKKLQAQLYDLIPLFSYGTSYTSLIKKAVEETGLKIESFEVKVKKSIINENKMLGEVEKKIRISKIPSYEKLFLTEKVNAIREKLKLIKLADYKSVIIMAKKSKSFLKG